MEGTSGNGYCDKSVVAMSVQRVRARRRVFRDFVLSTGALVMLLGALVVFDPRVREEVSVRMNSARASTEIVSAGYRARTLSGVLVVALKDQYQQHAPLMIFVVAATVLTLFMVRT